jgi:leader peptidase (prepilin peptidase)/N-methyltransferase
MLERGISGQKADVAGVACPSSNVNRLVRLVGYVSLIGIVVLSLVPVEWRPSTGLAKQLEHGVAYWIFAVVLTVAGLARWPQMLAIVVLAAALEFGQVFVPGRDSSLTDFLASAAGALLGFGLCSLVLDLVSRDRAWRLFDHPAGLKARVRLEAIAATVAVGVLAVGISMAVAHGTPGWLGAGLALAMLAIALVDGQHFIIPDPLNAAGLALGLANSAVLGQGDLIAAMAGAAARAAVLALAFLALRLIYIRLRGRHGIGLGDVKLAAVAGVWLDWSVMPIAVEIAALSALSIYVLRRYVLRHPLRSSSRLPFGLYFAPAIWIGWLLQTTLMQGW